MGNGKLISEHSHAAPRNFEAPFLTLGDLIFRTKTEAKRYFSALRDRYRDGERIRQEDEHLLRELIACHPETAEKTGLGIAFFTVATDPKFRRTRHFVVHRLTGGPTDFSFHACIDGPNERRDKLGALRSAIQDQIIEFRNAAFSSGPLTCPLRGVPITPGAYHVDHTPPATFAALVGAWLEATGASLMAIQITPAADNQIVAEMTEAAQISSWRAFHRRHASLRMLSPRANLSEACRDTNR